MTEHLRAYNSVWQVRGDSWCRLEEAADRLTRPTTAGAQGQVREICQELLAQLSRWSRTGPTRARRSSPGCSDCSPPAATTSSRRRCRGSTAR